MLLETSLLCGFDSFALTILSATCGHEVLIFLNSACEYRLPFLTAYSHAINSIAAHRKSKSGRPRNPNGASRRDFHLGLDDVLFPISPTCGNVSRQNKTGQSGHGNVVRPPYSRFEHASTPDRDRAFPAEIVNAPCLCMSADSTEFDVN